MISIPSIDFLQVPEFEGLFGPRDVLLVSMDVLVKMRAEFPKDPLVKVQIVPKFNLGLRVVVEEMLPAGSMIFMPQRGMHESEGAFARRCVAIRELLLPTPGGPRV